MIFRLAFFSMLIVASLLLLYFLTRNKWNWGEYAGSLAITFSALLLIPLGMFAWVSYEDRLQVVTQFDGIHLDATSAEVKFLKGAPDLELGSPDKKVLWQYQNKLSSGSLLDVVFENEKVVELSFTGLCEYCNNINGFGINTLYEDVIKRFGEPTSTTISDDELEHRIHYPEYNIFFALREGKVVRHGIFK